MEFLTGAVQKEDLGIAEILAGDYEGKNIKVKGAIHTIRDMGGGCIHRLKTQGRTRTVCIRAGQIPV